MEYCEGRQDGRKVDRKLSSQLWCPALMSRHRESQLGTLESDDDIQCPADEVFEWFLVLSVGLMLELVPYTGRSLEEGNTVFRARIRTQLE